MEIKWKYYFFQELWTERTAICLLFECEPTKFRFDHEIQDNPFFIRHKCKRLDSAIQLTPSEKVQLIDRIDKGLAVLRSDILANKLHADNFENNVDNHPMLYLKNQIAKKEFLIKPTDFIFWAIANNQLKVPQQMRSFFNKAKQELPKISKDEMRANHVKEWVEINGYEGGMLDKEINTALHSEKPELWGETIETFRAWKRSDYGKLVIHLLPNKRR